jgi:hypothetical protein
MNELTKEQQVAMKPWVIKALVAAIVRLVAIGLFLAYLWHTPSADFKIVALWITAIILIPLTVVTIGSYHITRIKVMDLHEALWILTIISILLFVALSYFTW